MEKLTCQKCHYQWTARTDQPKECPNCKTRNWNTATALLAVIALCLCVVGCAPHKVSLHDLQEYDQAIKIAEQNNMDTTAMHKHLVEMMVSYLKNPGQDPYVKAMQDAADAQQMQAINGTIAVIQQQQQYPDPPLMSPGEFRRSH